MLSLNELCDRYGVILSRDKSNNIKVKCKQGACTWSGVKSRLPEHIAGSTGVNSPAGLACNARSCTFASDEAKMTCRAYELARAERHLARKRLMAKEMGVSIDNEAAEGSESAAKRSKRGEDAPDASDALVTSSRPGPPLALPPQEPFPPQLQQQQQLQPQPQLDAGAQLVAAAAEAGAAAGASSQGPGPPPPPAPATAVPSMAAVAMPSGGHMLAPSLTQPSERPYLENGATPWIYVPVTMMGAPMQSGHNLQQLPHAQDPAGYAVMPSPLALSEGAQFPGSVDVVNLGVALSGATYAVTKLGATRRHLSGSELSSALLGCPEWQHLVKQMLSVTQPSMQ